MEPRTTCENCDRRLFGKQTRWCSVSCSLKARRQRTKAQRTAYMREWRRHRRLLTHRVTPDEARLAELEAETFIARASLSRGPIA